MSCYFSGGVGRLVTFSRLGYIFGEHYLTCHHSQMFHGSYRGVTMKIQQLAPCSPQISGSICSSFIMKSCHPGGTTQVRESFSAKVRVWQCHNRCIQAFVSSTSSWEKWVNSQRKASSSCQTEILICVYLSLHIVGNVSVYEYIHIIIIDTVIVIVVVVSFQIIIIHYYTMFTIAIASTIFYSYYFIIFIWAYCCWLISFVC